MPEDSELPASTSEALANGGIDFIYDVSRGERQRRRRFGQPMVDLPSFDDELKEGTELQNSTFTDDDKSHHGRQESSLEEINERGPEASNQHRPAPDLEAPRRIRSQFLDLNRGLSMNLASVNEDIVALSNEDFHNIIHREAQNSTDILSTESDKVYVERKGRFYTISKRDLESASQKTAQHKERPDLIAKDSVVTHSTSYKLLRRLFLFAHGLLAGLALFHCIFVYTVSPPREEDWMLFARMYMALGMWVKTVYQGLVALCCVSCLCRVDLIGVADYKHILRNTESIFAMIFYFGAAALSHLCDITTIHLFTQWTAIVQKGFSLEVMEELWRWKIMDTVRTALVCAGWLAVAFNWRNDRLKSHVKNRVVKNM